MQNPLTQPAPLDRELALRTAHLCIDAARRQSVVSGMRGHESPIADFAERLLLWASWGRPS